MGARWSSSETSLRTMSRRASVAASRVRCYLTNVPGRGAKVRPNLRLGMWTRRPPRQYPESVRTHLIREALWALRWFPARVVSSMARISGNVLEAVGNTPLVRLNRMAKGVAAAIYVKVEAMNPGRSVKDRMGLAMVEEAERKGLLGPGGTIVEPTSGNTGVALALVAAVKGYRCIFTIP